MGTTKCSPRPGCLPVVLDEDGRERLEVRTRLDLLNLPIGRGWWRMLIREATGRRDLGSRTARRAMVAVLVLASVSCSPPPVAIADVDALADRTGDAVWQVEADGCGWKMRGSAFAIDKRHLVTNHHVIANDSSPIIRSRDGNERQGKVIGASTHPDVAVIEVTDDLPMHVKWARTSSLAAREQLVVIGYPSPAYVFNTSTGQIVNFQGPSGTREAALVNAAVAGGNSGGPGLRGDASVAGVVTQMRVRDLPSEQHVAILFTADTVRPTVTTFLRKPTKVLSSCGLGPDYIPPVPQNYDIKAAPPRAEPIRALPVPSAAPKAPIASTPRRSLNERPTAAPEEPLACPEGGPVIEVNEVTATEEAENGPGWWTLDVRGLVDNYSYGRIVIRVAVTVDGDPPVTGPARGHAGTLEPFQKTGWVFDGRSVYSPSGKPTRAEATLDWYWLDSKDWPRASECPSDNITSSGPNPTPSRRQAEPLRESRSRSGSLTRGSTARGA